MTITTQHDSHTPESTTLRQKFNRFLERHLPEGLYPRSLIIIVTPVVLLQAIIAFTFMERHWETVTKRLSRAVTQDIAMLIDTYETYPQQQNSEHLIRLADQHLDIALSINKGEELPKEQPEYFFSLLDNTLTKQIQKRIGRPFWIDTFGQSKYVDIRIKVDDSVFRFVTKRSRTYASNSHIFILWMLGSALVLLGVAIIFLHNQIRPILQLASAARSFGMGRDVPDFHPRGALEIKNAAEAVINMRQRIKRHFEQRTAMLAGVSHDLRTILTRFKLQLAMLGKSDEITDLERDVDEMQHMLEDYMAFVRGDGGEATSETDVSTILEDIRLEALVTDKHVDLTMGKNLKIPVKPKALKRAIANLVSNACRYADKVTITAKRKDGYLRILVEDDGPGIPEDAREDVFRPFFRLDEARNLDTTGTGLGLAIARDIVQSHGGDIELGTSAMGGLKAELRLPV